MTHHIIFIAAIAATLSFLALAGALINRRLLHRTIFSAKIAPHRSIIKK